MPVLSTEKDTSALTLTLVAELDAGLERVWQLWADPRQLERWWGPPTWPATFAELDLRPGGTARYWMTGPEGEKAGGVWEFTSVDEPTALAFEDRFADDEGHPVADMPVTRMIATIAPAEGDDTRTRMTITSRFDSLEQLEQLAAMGMVEGLTLAVGQIDEILAE